MTRMVQISDEAYRRLKQEKKPGESFSDVILRRFPQGSLQALRGTATPAETAAALRQLQAIDAFSKEKQDRRVE